eukprot:2852798-Prymnesium_polylepis.2
MYVYICSSSIHELRAGARAEGRRTVAFGAKKRPAHPPTIAVGANPRGARDSRAAGRTAAAWGASSAAVRGVTVT